ncbi:MAG: hypothetical protein UY05_C0049G0001, partial [Candidatus Peregrinibacteria bacterium GW2011_GWA2_47_7]
IPVEDYRKITLVSYRDFMKWKSNRSMVQKAALELQGAAAAVGLAEKPTVEEERMVKSEETMRRFLADNQDAIATLSFPAGVSVGTVLKMLAQSGAKLKVKEPGPQAKREGPPPVLPPSVQEDAKRLPSDSFKLFEAHERMLAELQDKNNIASNEDIGELISHGNAVVAAINDKIAHSSDKGKREVLQRESASMDRLITAVRQAQAKRTQALADYQEAVKNHATVEILNEKFIGYIDANKSVMVHYHILEDELANRHKWTAIGVEFTFRSTRRLYAWYVRPEALSMMIKYHYGRFGIPSAFIAQARESIRRGKVSGIELTMRSIEEGERRLRGNLAGNLESRARPEVADEARVTTEKVAHSRYVAEEALLNHDKAILAAEQELERLTEKAITMKSGTHSSKALQKLEQKIMEKTGALRGLRQIRLRLEKTAIAEASNEMYGRLKGVADEALTHEQWREVDDLAQRGTEHCRNLEREGERILAEVKSVAKRGGTKAEVEALQKSFNETVAEIPRTQKSLLQRVGAFIKTRESIATAAGRKSGLAEEETKQFRKVLTKIFKWQKRGISATATEDAQAALDVAPLTGTVSDFYTMIKGQEAISGRKVTGLERWLMRPAFGLVGAASDILLIFGLGVGMRAGLGALKGGIEASRIARVAAAMKAAAKAGGEATAKAGGKAAAEAVGEGGAKVAAKEGTEIVAEGAGAVVHGAEALLAGSTKERGALMRALGAFTERRTAITLGVVALTVGGDQAIQLKVDKQDEMEIPKSVMNIMGGQDIDPAKLAAANDDNEEPESLSEGQARAANHG